MFISYALKDVDLNLTSTNFMTGTGLKKWRPPNLSLRCVAEASSAMESDEVLLANTVELQKKRHTLCNRKHHRCPQILLPTMCGKGQVCELVHLC